MLFGQDTAVILSSLSVFTANFSTCRRIHVAARPHNALTFRLSGKISVDANGKSIVSPPGSLTFVPAGLAYETEIYEGGSMYVIHFLTQNKASLTHGIFQPANPLLYRNFFAELYARYRPGRECDFDCFSLFYQILAEIRREETAASAFMPLRVRAAKNHIEKHFGETELSVAALAANAGVSEVYFRKEFTKYCGMAPNAYITKIRIDNAKSLLKTGYYSVTETAMRCGFDSVSYFSDRFKATVGIPPKEYKERAQRPPKP